jgi:hypothetical protein
MEIRSRVNDQIGDIAKGRTRHREAAPSTSFRQVVEEANREATATVKVQRGDTLVSLTRHFLGESAAQLNKGQIYDLAKTLAKENGIANPDRIMPGQQISMTPMSTLAALKLRQGTVEGVQLNTESPQVSAPVLDKTLARAVTKGYMQAEDQRAVRDKILQLATTHGFTPDDFARTTLMESDGMNPRASNGSCHGIIQFCSGGNRGAASAGYADNPKEILSLSVMDQLDLVDKYFTDTKLKDFGPASLDNLYLTVLTPNARHEPRANVPLNIVGRQAAALYEGRDQSGVITRNSLIAGLKQNARERLGEFSVAKVERKMM